MVDKDKIRISKFMSKVLRHSPEMIGISLDENGWADTQELIDGMNRSNLKDFRLFEGSCRVKRQATLQV